jgi:hypothetical protein
MNGNTVFQRTALGQQTSRDANSPIPRTLRTLLMSIDGKTTVDTYQRFLGSFGDVSALLEALQAGGYIEEVGLATRTRPGVGTGADKAEGAMSNFSRGFSSTQFRSDAPSVPAKSTLDELSSRLDTRPMQAASQFGRPTQSLQGIGPGSQHSPPSQLSDFGGQAYDPYRPLPANRLAGTAATINESARVKSAKAMMTEFLFANMPDMALEATLMIDRLETTEQVLTNLAGYERLIAKLGRPAAQHVIEIRQVLSQ